MEPKLDKVNRSSDCLLGLKSEEIDIEGGPKNEQERKRKREPEREGRERCREEGDVERGGERVSERDKRGRILCVNIVYLSAVMLWNIHLTYCSVPYKNHRHLGTDRCQVKDNHHNYELRRERERGGGDGEKEGEREK